MRRHRKKDFYCDGTLKNDIAGVLTTDAGDSFEDGRIKAFNVIGSAPRQDFAPDSLRSISAPFVLDTAQFDEILDPLANSTNLARQIPTAGEVVRPVGHFAYVPECRWLVGPILTIFAGPLCDDPKGGDRALIYKQVTLEIVAFFDKNLAGTDQLPRKAQGGWGRFSEDAKRRRSQPLGFRVSKQNGSVSRRSLVIWGMSV